MKLTICDDCQAPGRLKIRHLAEQLRKKAFAQRRPDLLLLEALHILERKIVDGLGVCQFDEADAVLRQNEALGMRLAKDIFEDHVIPRQRALKAIQGNWTTGLRGIGERRC